MAAGKMDRAAAEELAVTALGFIGGDDTLLNRFLALSGIQAVDVRRAAAESGFLAGVLNFIAAHEPTLLAFAQAADIPPARVVEAMRALPAGNDNYEHST